MKKLTGKKILVTGGLGFIGSNIAKTLYPDNEVTIIDNGITGHERNVQDFKSEITVVKEDLRKRESVQKVMKGCDYVLHQAAIPSVPRSTINPEESFYNNCEITLNVLQAAKEAQVKRVVYASSSSVYGNSDPSKPKVETLPTVPISLYGTYKLTSELMCRNFYWLYGLETVSLRYFNVFGPHQNPQSEYAAVIPRFMTAISQNKQPAIFGDGTQTRDFTFVENNVQANILACLAPKEACGEAINVAAGKPYALNDIVKCINEILGKNVQPIYQEERKGDIKHSHADISKAQRLLGYATTIDLKEGLKKTAEWITSRPEFMDKTKK